MAAVPTAAAGVTTTRASIILVVPTAELAKALQGSVRAWTVRPEKGMGRIQVRVVIAPDPAMTDDEAWIMTQIVELGIAKPEDVSQASLLFWPKE